MSEYNNLNSTPEDISDSVDKPVDSDLIKAQHYELVKQHGNGHNIKEASRRTGIAFSTLWEELRFWEFAGLVKLHNKFENGRSVKIIETIKKEGENGNL